MLGSPVVEIWDGAAGKARDDPKGAFTARASSIKVDFTEGAQLKCATDAESVFAAGELKLRCELNPSDS
jgi:hypothetical protein